jgi:dTDP-glucose pyrophosphorylase
MIYHVLKTLYDGGVTDVVMSLNWIHPGLMLETVVNFDDIPINIVYTYSAGFKGGPARDLRQVAPWLRGEDAFVLMLGDSLFFSPLDFVTPQAPHIWTMPLTGIDDPRKYGQVRVDGDRVLEIREKPSTLFSETIQTGVWKLPADAFLRAQKLADSRDGELHIGDITCTYVTDGSMTHTPLRARSYIDCGTVDALAYASKRILGKKRPQRVTRAAE